jgi:hypothetical protein
MEWKAKVTSQHEHLGHCSWTRLTFSPWDILGCKQIACSVHLPFDYRLPVRYSQEDSDNCSERCCPATLGSASVAVDMPAGGDIGADNT